MMLVAFYSVGPVVANLTTLVVDKGVDAISYRAIKLAPLASMFIEPAKTLLNPLKPGIFTPIGTQQVVDAGKSILFLLKLTLDQVLVSYFALRSSEKVLQNHLHGVYNVNSLRRWDS